ncbi:reverse transcriptase domain-containing protein [Tanacetum coccineum]
MKHSYSNDDTCFSINVIDEILEEDFNALLDEGSKILHSIEGTLLKEEIFLEFDEFIAMAEDENSESKSDTEEPPFEKIIINTDYKIKTSLEEPPTNLELKPLPDNLEYVFLEEPSFLPVIISSQLSAQKKSKLVSVLKKHKEAFTWKTTDILDTGIIYPIVDSPWVSPIHCVPKKGGITVVTNKNDELVPTRTVMGWRVCIDYHKLNEATAKDHFPLSFMDKMLERLTGNKYFCFLDGFSGYFQIPIDSNDQEKTTFTCPFGTYAYRRIPFGLCNALATFQRCMMAIFHDMIEESVKEKCHFMVKEEIMLGHKVSGAGLEVNRAKINVISKLSPPTNIKGVRSFLGHAGFYRSFIKDFSNIARPITKLLEKDTPFEFNDECQKAFDLLKEKLTCAPVIVSPNWNLSFELMCDASDFAVGAVLGQKDEFDIEIKDIKGTKNVAVDHLSRIENDESSDDSEVDDNFPRETLMEINTKDEPWFADFANYLVADIIPKGMTYQQKKKFFSDLKHYFWEEPYILKVCSDGIIRRWPFPKSHKFEYILVAVDYVSKWAETQALPTNDARVVITFLKKLFCRFRMPKALISNRVVKLKTRTELLKEFKHRNKVLLFHSKYKFKQPKLRSRWLGPYVVKHQYPSGYVELYGKDGKTFIVNGHRLKLYHEEKDYNDPREEVTPFFPKE